MNKILIQANQEQMKLGKDNLKSKKKLNTSEDKLFGDKLMIISSN